MILNKTTPYLLLAAFFAGTLALPETDDYHGADGPAWSAS